MEIGTRQTKKLLEKTIKLWKLIKRGKGLDYGAGSYPLCKKFHNLSPVLWCLGCPIRSKTRFHRCDCSPYNGWATHSAECHNYHTHPFRVQCEECKNIAQKFIDYLKTLLVELEKNGYIEYKYGGKE